jgi:hypothetical protein
MKNAFLLVIGLCVCAGSVSADYNNPPGWETDDYFTHQSWSFTNDTNPSAPDDGGAGNPYGTASLTFSNAEWVDDMGMMYDPATFAPLGVRQGGWAINGPQAGTEWYRIDIPNQPDETKYKELWFEMTFRVSSQALAIEIVDRVDLSVYADGIFDGDHQFTALDPVGGVIGVDASSQIWLRFEGQFTFDPQPGSEVVILGGTLNAGEGVVLDQIDIDTRSIPEPMSICLLGVGVLGVIRRKR